MSQADTSGEARRRRFAPGSWLAPPLLPLLPPQPPLLGGNSRWRTTPRPSKWSTSRRSGAPAAPRTVFAAIAVGPADREEWHSA